MNAEFDIVTPSLTLFTTRQSRFARFGHLGRERASEQQYVLFNEVNDV